MDSRQVTAISRTAMVGCAAITTMLLATAPALGQVRVKTPDRGSYQSPVLQTIEVESIVTGSANDAESVNDIEAVRRVNHESTKLVKPTAKLAGLPVPPSDQAGLEPALVWNDHELGQQQDDPIWHDPTCDGCSFCDDGCDSIGSHKAAGFGHWSNSAIYLDRGRWFGGVELLLMFRKGDRLPPLITTSSDGNPDPDTAGELGQDGTVILYGAERALADLRAGGRLTLGTWIDPSCCRSLVLRGWFAGQETTSFGANQSQFPVITRPFLNVSDNQVPAQDTQIIAFPDRASGSISARATSDLYGGDVSARQKWFSRFGGTVDVLYGYQYMRLSEDLSISSSSISQDADFAPLGSVLAINDLFEVKNEFHGGQFGLASRYREGCWSFHSLAKVGFGSLLRKTRLKGETFTSIDGNNAIDPNGLLVRSTNAGSTSDHTFGWVPELDLSLGWHQYPRFDLTFGYHIIAMTDALQVSETIDPALAVNLSDPPTGLQAPALRPRSETYYVQGIHFGLQHVY